jgi:hypothetical protein
MMRASCEHEMVLFNDFNNFNIESTELSHTQNKNCLGWKKNHFSLTRI